MCKSCLCQWAVPENIHTPRRTAFWNSEGKGGFFELEFRGHGGILTIGIPEAWGSSRSWISRGDRQKCVPSNANFVDYSFVNKARTDDRVAEAGYKKIQDKYRSIRRVFAFIYKRYAIPTIICGLYIKLQRP